MFFAPLYESAFDAVDGSSTAKDVGAVEASHKSEEQLMQTMVPSLFVLEFDVAQSPAA
jgi:hypothetical protein